MAKAHVGCRLVEIQLSGEQWPLDNKGRHIREMPRAHRRDLKSLRSRPEPIQPAAFVGCHEPVRQTVPDTINEPAAASLVLIDEHAFCFAGPPLARRDDLLDHDMFMSQSAEFTTGTSDWAFPGYQDDPSIQTGAICWPLFD
jgi:hypothetical protein